MDKDNCPQTYKNTRFTRQGGNKLLLVVERGEMIVPSLNSAFPKPKEEAVEKPKSYSQEVKLIKEWHKFTFVLSGAGEDWPTARAEGAGLHHGGQGEDGQQAVQLTHGHVQRGHHWGDHDTGVLGPQSMVYVKIQN